MTAKGTRVVDGIHELTEDVSGSKYWNPDIAPTTAAVNTPGASSYDVVASAIWCTAIFPPNDAVEYPATSSPSPAARNCDAKISPAAAVSSSGTTSNTAVGVADSVGHTPRSTTCSAPVSSPYTRHAVPPSVASATAATAPIANPIAASPTSACPATVVIEPWGPVTPSHGSQASGEPASPPPPASTTPASSSTRTRSSSR